MIGGFLFLSIGREKVLILGSAKKRLHSKQHVSLQFLIRDLHPEEGGGQVAQLSWEKNYRIRKVCAPSFFFFPKKMKLLFQFWFVPEILFLSNLNEFLMLI